MMDPPLSVFNLSELVETAARLKQEARQLVNLAGRACLVSHQLEDHSRIARERRREWAAILAHIPLDPDHLVVLCVSCRRVQAAHGWTILPAGLEDRLLAWDRALVSHAFCPDCRRHQLITGWPTIEASATC